MARKDSPITSRRISTERQGLFSRTDAPVEPDQEPKPIREKRTYHLPPSTVMLLGELQLEQHRATGKKPELSDLVSEAIELLAEKRRSAS